MRGRHLNALNLLKPISMVRPHVALKQRRSDADNVNDPYWALQIIKNMDATPTEPADLAIRAAPAEQEQVALLHQLLEDRLLEAHFQPILNLSTSEVIGYEGLIRGPVGTSLRAPLELFRLADKFGYALRLERLCRQTVLERFSTLNLPHKLFLNVRPQCLALPGLGTSSTRELLKRLQLEPERIVIELTENLPIFDFDSVRAALMTYRQLGFSVAIDDLGEGFASFRLWSELRPEYVKADMHFVQGIDADPLKLQFLKSIQQIADSCQTHIVAEGIETEAELTVVRDLGVAFAQGRLIASPAASPARVVPNNVRSLLRQQAIAVYPETLVLNNNTVSAQKLLIHVEPVAPTMQADRVYARFEREPSLQAIPIVADGVPVGLVNRHQFMDDYARPYRKEIFGRKPCSALMECDPLIVDVDITIQELSIMLVDTESRYLSESFILTRQGKYAGLGTGRDLVREITNLQIKAARYANPLTLLPGNVPINEHIDRLLRARVSFLACHCDLDHFKPFNDAYGYRRGDDMIQFTGRVLSEMCDARLDFLGHIGGDDFMLLMQSDDAVERCRRSLAKFDDASKHFYADEDLTRGGLLAEDRRGNPMLHPLSALSIGAVMVEPGDYASHYEVSSAASEAKRYAKRTTGSFLFVERRRPAERRAENTSTFSRHSLSG
jgi:EAL domain-containing protein (putative c-di-GMP-specific phosphodiesterase class I)/GGDEF domain-containing protein